MSALREELQRMALKFRMNVFDKTEVIYEFVEDMKTAKSLQMLQTYVHCNKDVIDGEYMALDFGGSNVRLFIYNVAGKEVTLKKVTKFSLRGENYDYTTEEYTLSDIFDMVADKAAEIVEDGKKYLLGHTFSFAIGSTSQNEARVLSLSKGFRLRDAIDTDVNACLAEAFARKGLNIEPVTILNDTTATLLAGFAENRKTDMACIVGTGHNMCFVDTDGEIINMESGGFNNEAISLNEYDNLYLDKIPNERKYLMEALVGGKNSHILAGVLVDSLVAQGLIKPIANITPKMMSMVLEGELEELDADQNYALRRISRIIYRRAAILVACEIIAVVKYLEGNSFIDGVDHHVVFDGSVYEKTAYFRECITSELDDFFFEENKTITHSLMKDGSGLGAAISCATNPLR